MASILACCNLGLQPSTDYALVAMLDTGENVLHEQQELWQQMVQLSTAKAKEWEKKFWAAKQEHREALQAGEQLHADLKILTEKLEQTTAAHAHALAQATVIGQQVSEAHKRTTNLPAAAIMPQVG